MKDDTFSKEEARIIAEAYYNPKVETVEDFLNQLRAAFREAEDKVQFVTGWRRMFLQDFGSAIGINARIRASIAERKAA